jgi:hypothetical protein
MMQIVNDIGFSFRSNAMFLEDMDGYGKDGSKTNAASPRLDLSGWPWATWGGENNNSFPEEIRKYIEECGILNAAINAKDTMAVGKGLQPFLLTNIDSDGNEELTWLNDDEIITWLNQNKMTEKAIDFAYDEIAYGWRTGTFMLNADRTKINKVLRKDVFTARLAKIDPKSDEPDVIKYLYLSNNWDNVGFVPTKSKDKAVDRWTVAIPTLREDCEIEHLQSLKETTVERGEFEFAFIDRKKRNGRQYYPPPMWYSAVEWVKQTIEIPKQKNAIFKNSMLLRYVVTIHQKYWMDTFPDWSTKPDLQAARRNDTYDKIDNWLGGTVNQGKSLFAGTFTQPGAAEPIPYIKVETIDDKFKDGKLLLDSSAANVEVLMAMLLNPAFIGAGSVGGASHGSQSGGSNIRESYMTQIMLMEAERRHTAQILNIVADFNGWSAKYNKSAEFDADGNQTKPGKRLVFRFQSGLLTTLDTGKSTKSIAA